MKEKANLKSDEKFNIGKIYLQVCNLYVFSKYFKVFLCNLIVIITVFGSTHQIIIGDINITY